MSNFTSGWIQYRLRRKTKHSKAVTSMQKLCFACRGRKLCAGRKYEWDCCLVNNLGTPVLFQCIQYYSILHVFVDLLLFYVAWSIIHILFKCISYNKRLLHGESKILEGRSS